MPLRVRTAVLALATLTGLGGARAAETTPPARPHEHADDIWGADYFPNTPLTTFDGREVRFFDDLVRGKVVGINFIYTNCPDACPMETARLLEVQRLLGDRLGKDVFLYSISIDPDNDTPETLTAYMEKWGVGPGWTFLTGKSADILELRKRLGVYSDNEGEAGKKRDHNLSMVIGNQTTGRWMKRSPYENPYVLVTQLGSWLHNWKQPPVAGQDYANAPEIRKVSNGEDVFRTRCAACHTVGLGDIMEPEARRVGPDLYNITKLRPRAWLERWIAEPDAVLAEKDPLATALMQRYMGVQMPNLRLTHVDVQDVLQYLEDATTRLNQDLDQRFAAEKAARKAARAGRPATVASAPPSTTP